MRTCLEVSPGDGKLPGRHRANPGPRQRAMDSCKAIVLPMYVQLDQASIIVDLESWIFELSVLVARALA
jgi:hypothetical protein